MKKRIISFLAAITVAFTSAPVGIFQAEQVQAAYFELGSGTVRSDRLAFENDRAVLTLEVLGDNSLIRTNVVQDGKYLLTRPNGTYAYNGDSAGNTPDVSSGPAGMTLIQGHIYEARFSRSGADYTVEYFDITRGSMLWTFIMRSTNLTEDPAEVYATIEKGVVRVYNCTAAEAGFSEGSLSSAVVKYSHGVDRSRKIMSPNNTVPTGYDVNPDTQGKAKDGEYDKYFLKDRLQEVRVRIDGDNLDYVLQNAGAKESALAQSVTIGDVTVQNVGLKTKGNFTRNKTNESTSDRFSFTVNFGKYIKKKYGYSETQNFFGCSKISFNNFYFDKTMMKEYNAYRLMTEMGLPTPQYGLAKLYINDRFYGVYFMIESMDTNIISQYYHSSDNVSDYLAKPPYWIPRYNASYMDECIGENGEFTWESLVENDYIYEDEDEPGVYYYNGALADYTSLWENDPEMFQDVVKDIPAVLTWLYRLTMLSDGKDFKGDPIDVNSEEYLTLLNQVMDIDETVKYFAAHSFVIQMDNMFTWRQNYGLYVGKNAQAMLVPWDYDLAWGCDGEPSDGEAVANWNVDQLYNKVAAGVYHYTDNLSAYYKEFPLFNVIFQNKTLMDKFHVYIADCSKMTAMGGRTSDGRLYASGRYGKTIDALYDEVVEAAGESLAGNVFYLNGITQPADAEKGLKALKNIIALRAVGAWLQVNPVDAKVTAYGYATGSLGNDSGEAEYKAYGQKLAVVDDNTGIFTVADYDQEEKSGDTTEGPTLTVSVLPESDPICQNIKASLGTEAEGKNITVYSFTNTKAAAGEYRVFLPNLAKDPKVYLCAADGNGADEKETTDYGDGTISVSVGELTPLAVVGDVYRAGFAADEGVESIDVYDTKDYTSPGARSATYAVARDGETGAIDVTGNGQINFKVNVKNGYKIKSVTVAEENYKNIKTPAETENPHTYRLTKITGNLSVTIETEEATEYKAVFIKGEHIASIDLYHTQTYGDLPDETDVASAVVLDKTGRADMSGEGQINFKVNPEEGYVVKDIRITGGYYKNLKYPGDTGKEDVYRLTKISGDIKIEITAVGESELTPYRASFQKDKTVSVDVYYTQDYKKADETNADAAVARNSVSGKADITGNGQINFKVNVQKGYKIVSVTASTNHYKNIKGPADTQAENVYRITKITGDLTITIKTEKLPAEEKKDLGKCTLSLDKDSYVYDGKQKKPVVTVWNGSEKVDASEYDVSYSGNVNAGSAAVTVTAKAGGGYAGKKTAVFEIRAAGNRLLSGNRTIVSDYSKALQKITVTTTAKFGKIIYRSSNRKVKVSDTGTVTIPAKFTGTVKITLSVAKTANYGAAKAEVTIKIPANVKMKSAKASGSRKAVVKWRTVKDVSGYEISYANKSNFKGEKKVTVGSARTAKATLKKLSKGTWYVRVRTYLKGGSKKYYGGWSAKKQVKIKK